MEGPRVYLLRVREPVQSRAVFVLLANQVSDVPRELANGTAVRGCSVLLFSGNIFDLRQHYSFYKLHFDTLLREYDYAVLLASPRRWGAFSQL